MIVEGGNDASFERALLVYQQTLHAKRPSCFLGKHDRWLTKNSRDAPADFGLLRFQRSVDLFACTCEGCVQAGTLSHKAVAENGARRLSEVAVDFHVLS